MKQHVSIFLIKTMFIYHRIPLILAGSLALIITVIYMIAGSSSPGASPRAYRVVILSCMAVVLLAVGLVQIREKQDRLLVSLPVPIYSIGIVRILFPNIIWLILASLALTGHWIVWGHGTLGSYAKNLLAMTALIFLIHALLYIGRDFSSLGIKPHSLRSLMQILLVFMAYLLFLLTINSEQGLAPLKPLVWMKTCLNRLTSKWTGIIILFSLGVVSMVLSAALFKRKKTILE